METSTLLRERIRSRESLFPEFFTMNGDIFKSDNQILVNPVNCRGKHGRGLVGKLAWRYPEYLEIYDNRCQDGTYFPGKAYVSWEDIERRLLVIDLINRYEKQDRSQYDFIEQGLEEVGRILDGKPIFSGMTVSVPALSLRRRGLELERVIETVVEKLQSVRSIERINIYTNV